MTQKSTHRKYRKRGHAQAQHRRQKPVNPAWVHGAHAAELPYSMWTYLALGLACALALFLGLEAYQLATMGNGLFSQLGAAGAPAPVDEQPALPTAPSSRREHAPQAHREEKPAVDTADLSDVVEDGEQLEGKQAVEVAGNDDDCTQRIEAMLQNPQLPAGCEPVSLTIVLNSMGFSLGLTDLVDTYLTPEKAAEVGYNGSPYLGGGAFPPAMVQVANNFLSDQQSALRAHDLTGTSLEGLLALNRHGYPVLIWTTMYMEQPAFTGEMDQGHEWYRNEHCAVLYGQAGDKVLVSDPLEGLVERDHDEFERIYEQCGKMAAYVR